MVRETPSDAQAPTLGESPGAQMFANRLRKNLRTIGAWARRHGIDCYRLYDADIPEYALAVDLYRGESLWVHCQEYAAPRSVDPVDAARRLEEAMAIIPKLLGVPEEQVFLKVRQRQKGTSQYHKLAQQGRFHEVRDGPCRLLVNFTDYLDTGLFLDHRLTRALAAQLARGRKFLNLFAYTGKRQRACGPRRSGDHHHGGHVPYLPGLGATQPGAQRYRRTRAPADPGGLPGVAGAGQPGRGLAPLRRDIPGPTDLLQFKTDAQHLRRAARPPEADPAGAALAGTGRNPYLLQ